MKKSGLKSRMDLLRKEHRLPYSMPEPDAYPVALVYPNMYKVGMASLGFLTTYRLLIDAGFKPERFFLDVHSKSKIPISMESGSSLSDFTILAFHFSYEPDYVNAISMLNDSGIPYDRHLRGTRGKQILIAGGMAPTANPLPLVNFFDFVFLGETEDDILSDIHRISDKLPISSNDGWFSIVDYLDNKGNYTVRRRTSPEWESFDSFSPIITSETTFGAMNLVEISRGCPIKCKFCLTGGMFKKVRERNFNSIISSAIVHKEHSKKVGLIGAIPSLHSDVVRILEKLIADGMSVSLSSLSVTSLNDRIIELLSKGGMKTLTLGVENFDENLQMRYGKSIPFEKLENVIEKALRTGFREIKIYLMLGLPGATEDEENFLVNKATVVSGICRKVHPGSLLRISLNPFIPKALTEYEHEKFMGEKNFRDKMSFIRKKLSPLGIAISSESHRNARLQNILSRGDERVGEIILAASSGRNWKQISKNLIEDGDSFFQESLDTINKTFLRY